MKLTGYLAVYVKSGDINVVHSSYTVNKDVLTIGTLQYEIFVILERGIGLLVGGSGSGTVN